MFNSPILDVTIGLVFIFLLYSLLATSIKESIATAFALRARMLKKGIIDGMLSDTPDYGRWKSIFIGIGSYLLDMLALVTGKLGKKKNKLGDKFYNHPVIKNYGASRIFPLPSYISAENFSEILIAVLKEDFTNKLLQIAEYKKIKTQSPLDIEAIGRDLELNSDANKIKELLDYYAYAYSLAELPAGLIIDKDTCRILHLHLKNSLYSIESFAKKTCEWFNDSMDRVSGWYKRQVQVILFFIGIAIAVIFNVDTLQIADKLTTDKDARAKIVELAIKASDQYKNDPRVIINGKPRDSVISDSLLKLSQKELEDARKTLDSGITNANEILALGWDGYGRYDSAFLKILLDKTWVGPWYIDDSEEIMDTVTKQKARTDSVNRIKKDSSTSTILSLVDQLKKDFQGRKISAIVYQRRNDSLKQQLVKLDSIYAPVNLYHLFYNWQYEHYPVHVKTAYVWYELRIEKKKLLGFLITAFAICLGAPFWFDLLNKLVKLRAAGKKEETATTDNKTQTTAQQSPVNINLNTQKTGEEAVG